MSTVPDIIKDNNLSEKDTNIANQIIAEEDFSKIKDLTDLFNLNQAKKNILRIIKLNGLYDSITDQMVERLGATPQHFSNDDLLSYLQVVQSAIEKSTKIVNQADTAPAISLQQNNVNICVNNELSKEERNNVAQAVSAILAKIQSSNGDIKESLKDIESEDYTEKTN